MSKKNYVNKAIKIVVEAFEGKKDLAGEPYLHHVNRVADGVQIYGDENVFIIALLHDLVEDCPEWPEERLREEFPKRICDGVMLLTKKDWQTYNQYIWAMEANPDVIRVKLSDLQDNMDITRLKVLTEKDFRRLQKYHEAYKTLSQWLN